MKFKGWVVLSMVPGEDGSVWRLEDNFLYESKHGRLKVAGGFRTDGASIPRIFWRVIGCPLRARYTPAAILHDALYQAGYLTREESDKVLLEAMGECDVHPLRAYAIYLAVRAGGWLPWRKHRNEEADG